MIAFGPVPSRRLGQSVGINNIPPKVCSYNCVYCQVGRTLHQTCTRQYFYDTATIAASVRELLQRHGKTGKPVDYLTLVPDGEPTLDLRLPDIIGALREFGPKIAVISNASLLWDPTVRSELALADCVSLKVDAVSEEIWRAINRPEPSLSLEAILDGIQAFAAAFRGELLTETMLIRGLNDAKEELERTADFIAEIKPAAAYLALPTRPTSESWASFPEEEQILSAFQIFSERIENVETLYGFAEEPFSLSGDAAESILNITFVHPMRESEALEALARAGRDHAVLDELIRSGQLKRILHKGQPFYVRKIT